ncbi:protein YgfX [Pseudomonas sp. NA-150]|uniref:protein YgfX n=1 Tax=Pseudomonas sp. NA-150 TaxID=3367525 RepID=UPI0037C70006
MSSRSDRFECRWQASRLLLAAYLISQALALVSLYFLDIPVWACALGVVSCLVHGVWALPRFILLNHASAFTGLRRDADGWQLWSAAGGWQAVQLRRDSLALPLTVVLRFRLIGKRPLFERRLRGLCIPRDALPPDVHRRLRVRLKFSRRRWAAAE